MKKIGMLVLMFILFPTTIFGYECSVSDKERLQKMADNITYIVEENFDENGHFNGTFRIIFSGVSDELTMHDNRGRYYYNYEDYNYGEYFTEDISENVSYVTEVNGYDKCVFVNFRTITINLPKYNSYYDDPLCDDARDLNICGKWDAPNISYEQFLNKIEEYKNSKNNYVPSSDNKTDKNWLYNIYEKYYWYGLFGLICILIVLIILWIKEQEKNKL